MLTVPQAGESVSADMPCIQIANPDKLRVRAQSPELYVGELAVGQRANITFSAVDGTFHAELTAIAPAAVKTFSLTNEDAEATVEVLLDLNDSTENLRPGYSATVKVFTDHRDDAAVVPYEAICQRGEQEFVFCVQDGHAVQCAVQTGYLLEDTVEILDGLPTGVSVILSPPDELTDGDPVEGITDMRLRDILSLAAHNLRESPLRTALCALSVAVGSGALLLILSIGLYGRKQVDVGLQTLGVSGLSVYTESGHAGTILSAALADEIEQDVDGIRTLMPIKAQSGTVRVGHTTEHAVLLGADERLGEVMQMEMLAGTLPNAWQCANAEPVAVVGDDLAQTLYRRTNITGRQIRLKVNGTDRYFTVCGVVRAQTGAFGGNAVGGCTASGLCAVCVYRVANRTHGSSVCAVHFADRYCFGQLSDRKVPDRSTAGARRACTEYVGCGADSYSSLPKWESACLPPSVR